MRTIFRLLLAVSTLALSACETLRPVKIGLCYENVCGTVTMPSRQAAFVPLLPRPPSPAFSLP